MKFKKILFIFVLCSAILILSTNVFADVLFGKSYQQTIHKHFTQAEDSITVAMYFIYPNFEDSDNPINQLVNDLIDARQRGVDVKVVLEGSKFNVNRLAYQKLRQNGVKVYFDTPEHLLHIKGVVIDNRYIFLGSANWSKAAIEKNYEATYFTDSPQKAKVLTQYINNIPVQEGDVLSPYTSGVSFSTDFLLSPKLGRKLFKSHGSKQFDLYLLLCKIQQETGQSRIIINYESIAKQMGYIELDDLGKYRSQYRYFWQRIHHLLTFLKRYGLIGYWKGEVTLKNNNPEKPSIMIPFEYWDYKYSDSLSMRMKYMYLVCLHEASKSTIYPVWFRGQKDMSKLYGISESAISQGLSELEDRGIVEITRDKSRPANWEDRKANEYKMIPLSAP